MQDIAEQVVEHDEIQDEIAEPTVEITVEALAGFGGCHNFVARAVEAAFAGRHLSREEVIGLAVECGLKTLRAPTEDELADPDWDGHAAGIQAGEERVWTDTDPLIAASSVVALMDEAVEDEGEPDEAPVQQ